VTDEIATKLATFLGFTGDLIPQCATQVTIPVFSCPGTVHTAELRKYQCCESGMFIPDPNFSISDPGSRVKKIPDI
jgi:hypothetical protein